MKKILRKVLRKGSQHKEVAAVSQSDRNHNHWLWSKQFPSNHVAQDIFLVSYPKSGSTYLRFLIANAIKAHFEIEREVNLFSIQDIIPWITDHDLSPLGPFGMASLPRIIKSHFAYNKKYRRVILLVRDPRDIFVSYFHHTRKYRLLNNEHIPENWSISDFIRDPMYAPELWAAHTQSWYRCRQNLDTNVQLLRYETLLSNPEEELHKVMTLIGINLSESSLKCAVGASSRDRMKRMEKLSSSTYTLQNQKTEFVRSVGAARKESLSLSDKAYIEGKTRETAQIIDYSF